MVVTEDVSVAGCYTCVHPAGHLKVSTEFTDLERRIAYQSTEGVHALGSSPCVLCRHRFSTEPEFSVPESPC